MSLRDIRVIGIDPGPKSVGYAYVEGSRNNIKRVEVGSLRFVVKDDGERLGRIFEAMEEIFGRFLPDAVAVEDVYTHKNPRLSLKIGEVKGIIKMFCWKKEVKCYEYTPATVKKQVGGNGAATKKDIRRALRFYVGDVRYPDEHGADALAVAICHIMRVK